MRPGAPLVEQALARVDPKREPSARPPGPTSADVAAAANMRAGDQTAMINGMVTRLAARLKEEPDDVEGWLRLIRSYVVLGTERRSGGGRARRASPASRTQARAGASRR